MVSLPLSLPKDAAIFVQEGEPVKKGQLLAKQEVSAEHVIHLAQVLHISPHKVGDLLLREPGDSLEKGDVIATRKKSMGFSKVKLLSNISGMITRFDAETGDLTVGGEIGEEKEIICPIDGVVQICNNEQIVIGTNESVVQGVGGFGKSIQGKIYVLPSVISPSDAQQLMIQLNSSITNNIILARSLHRDALIKAVGLESLGIIANTILPEDIEYLIQRNMLIPIILIDEGQLVKLSKKSGKNVYLDGSTSTILFLE